MHNPNPFANKRVLIFHHWPRSVQRRVMVSEDSFYISARNENHPQLIHVPRKARVDIGEVVAQLKATHDWEPDLFVANIDAYFEITPVNVGALKCPKLLILGDSHHGNAPLRSLVRYARSEPFDGFLTDYLRQHLWFYHLAGLRNLYWLPGLFVRPFESDPAAHAARLEKGVPGALEEQILFIGQAGQFHPRRRRLVDELKRRVTHFANPSLDQQTAQLAYERAAVSLNLTLNADVNLRFFEIAAAAGFQLADRLSYESGISQVFREGQEIAFFDGIEDLSEQAQRYSGDVALNRKIRAAARHRFDQICAPDVLLSVLGKIAMGDPVDPLYNGDQVERIRLIESDPNDAGGKNGEARLELYEIVQQLHRDLESVHLLIDGATGSVWPEDYLDLPRVRVSVLNAGQDVRDRLDAYEKASPDASRLAWLNRIDGDEFELALARSPTQLPEGLHLRDGMIFVFPDRSGSREKAWNVARYSR